MASAVAQGAPHRYVPVPNTGSGQRLSETDWIQLEMTGEGIPRERMPQELVTRIGKLNRKLLGSDNAIGFRSAV